jgi:hypothetical protein
VQCVTDRHDGQAFCQLGPSLVRWVEWLHDETVDPLVPELIGKKHLAFGVASGVHEEDVVVTGQQRAADADAE